MKKVLLIAQFGQFGGTRTFFRRLIRFYSTHGFQVVVVLSREQLDAETKDMLEKCQFRWEIVSEQQGSLFSWLWKRFPFNALRDVWRVLPFIRQEKPDLLVASVGSPGLFLGLVMLPYRFLCILHTYPHGTSDDVSVVHRSRLGKWMKKVLIGMFLGRKKMILTVSNFAKEHIVDAWLSDARKSAVNVVYNTAGESRTECRPKTIRNDQKVRVLTLGHVTWYKNPLAWLAVAQKVMTAPAGKDVEFVWAGDGDQFEECRETVLSARLEHRIKFVGFRESVEDLYLSSHIYFQPSIVESHGLSVVEAMRYGLPCVVSNAGGLPESVVNDETGFVVNVDDIEAMAEVLLQLVIDPKLRERFALAACERYQLHFDAQAWNQKMLVIHGRLLSNSSSQV